MLKPPRPDPKRGGPPHWKLADLLECGTLAKQHSPGEGEIDGSHLTLIFFRDSVFDMPISDSIAIAVAEVDWMQHADDWTW